jgi:hypothetical protein
MEENEVPGTAPQPKTTSETPPDETAPGCRLAGRAVAIAEEKEDHSFTNGE